jgi:predicted transposase YbfD/YdcC
VTRELKAVACEPDAVAFPFVRTLLIVRCTRTVKRTGQTSHETRYYLSSHEPDEHTPAQWQELIRGHWGGVEIGNHWRRDVLWGEDGSRTRNPNALGNLALVRNALLALLPEHFPDLSLPQIFERLQSDPDHCYDIISKS